MPYPLHVTSINSIGVPVGAGVTLTVISGDTVYYADTPNVTANYYQGALNAGQNALVTDSPLWVRSASRSDITVAAYIAPVPGLSFPNASISVYGGVALFKAPNVAGTAVALGANTAPQDLAINGPFPLPPLLTPNVDATMFRQALSGGLAAAAVVQGSPRDCSGAPYLYRYMALFVGTAVATLVIQSSPDMITWTQESSTAATQLASTGVWSVQVATTAIQSYYRFIFTNGAGAQGATAKLVDGVKTLVAA